MAHKKSQKRIPYSKRKYVIFASKFQVEMKKYRDTMLKDETEGLKLKTKILSAYGENGEDMPERTFYNQLEKQFPGIRKRRFDAGKEKKKLPNKVGKIVNEARAAGKSKKDAIKLAEEKTGETISAHKALSIKVTGKAAESVNAAEMGKFVAEIFGLDNMAPSAFLTIKAGKNKFRCGYEACMNIKLILDNEFNKSVEERFKLRVDNSQIRDIMVGELFEAEIRKATLSGDLKTVESLVRMKKSMTNKDKILSPNLKMAFKACQEFAKDVTMERFIAVIKMLYKGDMNG